MEPNVRIEVDRSALEKVEYAVTFVGELYTQGLEPAEELEMIQQLLVATGELHGAIGRRLEALGPIVAARAQRLEREAGIIQTGD